MYKILIIAGYPKISGVDFHRLVMPHNVLADNYNEFEISQATSIDYLDKEVINQFDLIIVNRVLSKANKTIECIKLLQELNVPYILDLDDDYKLPDWHILKQSALDFNQAAQIIQSCNNAIAVTVTHEFLANIILKETNQRNVFIVPNGIMPIGQFTPVEKDFKKLVYGWSGSITHFEDVLLLHDSLLYQYKYNADFKMAYGGYDSTDNHSKAIVGVLTCKGTASNNQFITYAATDVFQYGNFYNNINVCLIPLRNNRFNNCKSNLKLLEAGFKKCAVIISDVYPYSPDLEHEVNCLKVKKKNEWHKYITLLNKEPELAEKLANNLYEYIQKYHMNIIAEIRQTIYKKIIDGNNRN